MEANSNNLAVAELGIYTTAFYLLSALGKIADDKPWSPFQRAIVPLQKQLIADIERAAALLAKYLAANPSISKVLWLGHEGLVLDSFMKLNVPALRHILVANDNGINKERVINNYPSASNINFGDVVESLQQVFGNTVVVVTYFKLTDGTCWAYDYPANILSEHLYGKPRKIIGLCLLEDVEIIADEDHLLNALGLLRKFDEFLVHSIINVHPLTVLS